MHAVRSGSWRRVVKYRFLLSSPSLSLRLSLGPSRSPAHRSEAFAPDSLSTVGRRCSSAKPVQKLSASAACTLTPLSSVRPSARLRPRTAALWALTEEVQGSISRYQRPRSRSGAQSAGGVPASAASAALRALVALHGLLPFRRKPAIVVLCRNGAGSPPQRRRRRRTARIPGVRPTERERGQRRERRVRFGSRKRTGSERLERETEAPVLTSLESSGAR